MRKKIGIIGFGNMGSAIAQQLKLDFQVVIFDIDKNKTKQVSDLKVAEDSIDLINSVDIVILAVKPFDFNRLLNEIKNHVKNKLIISIAAGIATKYIERILKESKVVRVMPNLPLRVGKGMICLCKGKLASDKDLETSKGLFKKLGKTLILDENMINAATATSGSGPGFLFEQNQGKTIEEMKKYTEEIFIPTLAATAQKLGFTPKQSKIIAQTTGLGSIIFLEKTGLLPSQAKEQVASKGGTTAAGLEVLHKGGSLEEAFMAALKRAEELTKKE